MSQFNFGSNAGANTSNSGFPFGGAAKPATPAFASLGTAQPSGSITFGTPIASVAPTVQNYGLSFGTPTPSGGTGLSFGTPASSAPTTGLSFGTITKPTSLNFGTQPGLSTPGLSFGAATTSAATGLSFGTPATGGGLSFAAPVASTGFSLGGTTITSTATNNPLGGINFGATPVASTAGSLSFGNTNTNPLGGINFAAPALSGGLILGASTAATPGLSFGAVPTTTSAALNFGLGGAASSAATPTLNFKSSFTPASTATTGTGLNFGFNTPAKTQTTTALTLGAPTSSTPIGLGGVDSSLTKTGTVTTGRTDTLAAKENPVPNEILQSIESFKQFVKDQKAQSSDIARGSARPFVKVREDIDIINSVLTEVGNDLQRNQQQADKLKYDSAKCLHNAEMAQRTQDTPPGLQFENTAPLQYFMELVNQFEQDLHALRVQIDVTDKHFHSLHEPRFLTSQELATGMRRLHDTFVALAGRLHSVHTQVESHKEQYLNLRKYILKDPTNIFLKPENKEEEALESVLKGLSTNKTVSGPTPFSSLGSPFGMSMMAQQQAAAKLPPAYPASTTALNFGSNTTGANTSQLSANQSLFGTDTSGFQLQNPPLGNKRGKR